MSQPSLLRSDGGQDRVATPSQTVGPFFDFAIAPDARLGSVAADAGERIRLQVRVADGAGQPLPDALVEIYQADAAGHYATRGFSGFGRLATAIDGTCEFETIRPGRVRDAEGRAQASHINVCFFARGLLRHLYSRVYFSGDPDLDEDPMLALVPADRRSTLLAAPAGAPGTWTWSLRLQGAEETVFFDL